MEEFDQVAAEQGWNDDSIISILSDFITERGLAHDLGVYARSRADFENRTGG